MSTESSSQEARRKWILVVEDDADLREILEQELQNSGFRTLTSSKAHEAIRLLLNQKFECVILDMRLASGAGEEVVSSMRSDPRGFNYTTPVVVISGELDVELVTKIRGSVNAVFVKPFEMEKVIHKILSFPS